MRATEGFVLAACCAVLLCTLTAAPQSSQLFAAPSLPVRSSVETRAQLSSAGLREATSAPAFQIPAHPTEGQHNAATFFAGAALLAAVCCRGRVAAAVEGQEGLSAAVSRRAMLAGLAASPILAASLPAHADFNAQTGLGREQGKKKKPKAKPAWAKRKDAIETPTSVKKKCNVEKACNKGAKLGTDGSNKENDARFNAAVERFKARQPPEPAAE